MNWFPCAEHAEHGEQQGPGCIRGQPPRRLQVLQSTTHLSLRFSNSGQWACYREPDSKPGNYSHWQTYLTILYHLPVSNRKGPEFDTGKW